MENLCHVLSLLPCLASWEKARRTAIIQTWCSLIWHAAWTFSSLMIGGGGGGSGGQRQRKPLGEGEETSHLLQRETVYILETLSQSHY